MTLWGQAKPHWPHCTHSSWSHAATMSETLRFSNAAVPEGNVPSTGIWLTRRSSPRPSIIWAITSRTNAGALSGTSGR